MLRHEFCVHKLLWRFKLLHKALHLKLKIRILNWIVVDFVMFSQRVCMLCRFGYSMKGISVNFVLFLTCIKFPLYNKSPAQLVAPIIFDNWSDLWPTCIDSQTLKMIHVTVASVTFKEMLVQILCIFYIFFFINCYVL